ncbi:hypothetical protein EDB81DRAFT_794648 [Dactylonectria macrodidyma]|uniref:Apple domain-containing protein n=1 Tax=Dactylonectria macrodidyma TaxID=307937 RepID=A0A9P9EX71_9HYPO|nr:hypothetical protein EDB81DRAFT_794648 [Dactylonectria macrodidyma]
MRPTGSLALALVGFVDVGSASLLDQIRLFIQNATFHYLYPEYFATSQTNTPTPCMSSSSYLYTCPPGFTYPGTCHDAEALPAGAQCNMRGHFLSGDGWGIVYNGMPQDQIEDCAFICNSWYTCKSYGYNASDPDTPCRFYEKGLVEGGFIEEPISSTSWYDLGCADCTRCGSEPPSIVPGLPDTGPQCNLRSNVSVEYNCNQAGTVSAGGRFYDTMIYPHNADAENCATICSHLKGCRASAYDPSQGPYACLFSGYSLKDARFKKSPGTEIWSDEECWECTKSPGAI